MMSQKEIQIMEHGTIVNEDIKRRLKIEVKQILVVEDEIIIAEDIQRKFLILF
jgi:hypothetical protein